MPKWPVFGRLFLRRHSPSVINLNGTLPIDILITNKGRSVDATARESIAYQYAPALSKIAEAFTQAEMRWDFIEMTAKVVCPKEAAPFIPAVAQTKATFSELSRELRSRLAISYIQAPLTQLESAARNAMDMLVRNLFERTADIGFIACDGVLLDFMQGRGAVGDIVHRMQSYVSKYTVYEEAVLVDTDGVIRASVGDAGLLGQSVAGESWYRDAATARSYVESFGHTVLQPGRERLIYAHRMEVDGKAAGVVALLFGFEREMDSIFAEVLDQSDIALAIADPSGKVLATSNARVMQQGDVVEALESEEDFVLYANSRPYLVRESAAKGYQGYAGPPWTARAMRRIDRAMNAPADGAQTGVAPHDDRLNRIIEQASAIEQSLRCVVWNGKMHSDTGGGSVSALLDQISAAGAGTATLFDSSIGGLQSNLVRQSESDAIACASMAASILDRNLYERANDCRWWALSPDLCESLRAGDAARAQAVLRHLNSLYTVYSAIALFTPAGEVFASSADAAEPAVDAALAARTMGLPGEQSYAVSAFSPSTLSGSGAASYLFCAALPGGLGGVAVDLNCERELRGMLDSAVAGFPGAQAFFLDAQARVLATTSADHPILATLDVELDLRQVTEKPFVLALGGKAWLACIRRTAGYREFRVSDGYKEQVFCLVLLPMEEQRRQSALHASQEWAHAERGNLGVVRCGALRFALPADSVVSAVFRPRVSQLPQRGYVVGAMEARIEGKSVMVNVVDMRVLVGEERGPVHAVVIVRSGAQQLALVVDEILYVIPHHDEGRHPVPEAIHRTAPWITHIIDSAAGLIFQADLDRLLGSSRSTLEAAPALAELIEA
jgi:chemotaxis signal transduction protein